MKNSKSIIGLLIVFCFITVAFLAPAGANLVPSRSGSGGGPGNKLDSLKRLYGQKADQYLDRAKSYAEEVASSGNANLFGRVMENLNEADVKISEIKEKIVNWNIAGADADEYIAELNTKYQNTFADALSQCEAVLVTSLAEKPAPKDVYSAANKAKYHQMLMADWEKAWPNDKILGIRFPNAGFKQTVNEKRWDSDKKAWYWVKKSVLVAKVIVRVSPKLAAIYPAYINRDDLTKETNTGVYTKGSSYIIELMLVSNFK